MFKIERGTGFLYLFSARLRPVSGAFLGTSSFDLAFSITSLVTLSDLGQLVEGVSTGGFLMGFICCDSAGVSLLQRLYFFWNCMMVF
jgi:hypothetical protein